MLTAVMRVLGRLHFGRMPHMDWLLSPTGSANKFTDYFKGFEKVEAVKQIFGEKTQEVLQNLKVSFTYIGGYMWIDPRHGSLVISSHYLNEGDKTDIYLDIIHELVHIRQLMEGKKLFDAEYDYADRPTEIEAYQHAVDEARRLGMNDQQICEYLKTEWMSKEDLERLAKSVNVKCT
jgi:hypothetical protein